MVENALKNLITHQSRQVEMSPDLMEHQIRSVKKLVTAARSKLLKHTTDRDAGSDLPKKDRRYDSFFSFPDTDAVMSIFSVGLPFEVKENDLFVYIYKKDQEKVNQIVGLQTAKDPESVGKDEALWLSSYSPNQLEILSSIIDSAKPIDKAVYDEYIKPQVDDNTRLIA